MSVEVDVLIETYQTMFQYIPAKDRQEAADHLMSSLVDLLSDEEIKEMGAVDTYMKKALREYTADDIDEDYADEDE